MLGAARRNNRQASPGDDLRDRALATLMDLVKLTGVAIPDSTLRYFDEHFFCLTVGIVHKITRAQCVRASPRGSYSADAPGAAVWTGRFHGREPIEPGP